MRLDPRQMHETIFRLRRLHGVYERALQNVTKDRARFDRELAKAQKQLGAEGVWSGRWSLFSEDELELLLDRLMGSGPVSEMQAEMIEEVTFELAYRHVRAA